MNKFITFLSFLFMSVTIHSMDGLHYKIEEDTCYFYEYRIYKLDNYSMSFNVVSKELNFGNEIFSVLADTCNFSQSKYEYSPELYFGLKFVANNTNLLNNQDIESLYINLSERIKNNSTTLAYGLDNNQTLIYISVCEIYGLFFKTDNLILLDSNNDNFIENKNIKTSILYHINKINRVNVDLLPNCNNNIIFPDFVKRF